MVAFELMVRGDHGRGEHGRGIVGALLLVIPRRLFGWDLCRHAQGSEGEWVDMVVQQGEQWGEVSMRVAEVLGMGCGMAMCRVGLCLACPDGISDVPVSLWAW